MILSTYVTGVGIRLSLISSSQSFHRTLRILPCSHIDSPIDTKHNNYPILIMEFRACSRPLAFSFVLPYFRCILSHGCCVYRYLHRSCLVDVITAVSVRPDRTVHPHLLCMSYIVLPSYVRSLLVVFFSLWTIEMYVRTMIQNTSRSLNYYPVTIPKIYLKTSGLTHRNFSISNWFTGLYIVIKQRVIRGDFIFNFLSILSSLRRPSTSRSSTTGTEHSYNLTMAVASTNRQTITFGNGLIDAAKSIEIDAQKFLNLDTSQSVIRYKQMAPIVIARRLRATFERHKNQKLPGFIAEFETAQEYNILEGKSEFIEWTSIQSDGSVSSSHVTGKIQIWVRIDRQYWNSWRKHSQTRVSNHRIHLPTIDDCNDYRFRFLESHKPQGLFK